MKSLLWFLAFLILPRRWVYPAYMQSSTWRNRRNRIVKRDGQKCKGCGTRGRLEVHHKSYSLAGIEPGRHLITYCRSCHTSIHNAIRRGFLVVIGCLVVALHPVRAQQCDGVFLIYNHYGWFGQGFDCYTCGNNFLPVAAIKESTQGRHYQMYVSVTDTNGNRLTMPGSIGGYGVPHGIAYFNNRVWYGTLAPYWMGYTSSTWYFGQQHFVGVTGSSWQTNCRYQGAFHVRMYAKTFTPGSVGDTCYYDSTAIFPPCAPLGWTDPQPEPIQQPQPQEVDRWDVPHLGLTVLLLWDGTKYTTKKQKVIR